MSPIHKTLKVKDHGQTVSSLYNHIPNIINLSKKAKSYCPDTNTLKKYHLFDLKVKGQTESHTVS